MTGDDKPVHLWFRRAVTRGRAAGNPRADIPFDPLLPTSRASTLRLGWGFLGGDY